MHHPSTERSCDAELGLAASRIVATVKQISRILTVTYAPTCRIVTLKRYDEVVPRTEGGWWTMDVKWRRLLQIKRIGEPWTCPHRRRRFIFKQNYPGLYKVAHGNSPAVARSTVQAGCAELKHILVWPSPCRCYLTDQGVYVL